MTAEIGTITNYNSTSTAVVGSVTFAHNHNVIANDAIFVTAYWPSSAITGVTYNGNAMTLVNEVAGGRAAIYYITGQTSGSSDVVVSFALANQQRGCTVSAISINGVDPSGTIPATAETTYVSTSSFSTNITSINSDSLLLDFAAAQSAAVTGTPNAGQTEQVEFDGRFNTHLVSTAEATGASESMGWGLSGTTSCYHVVAEIRLLSFLPEATTGTMSDVFVFSSTISGNISGEGDGGLAVTEKGVVVSETPNPDITDLKFSSGSGDGTYATDISALSDGTLYYARAYSTNVGGTTYGDDITFKTDEDKAGILTISTDPIIFT